MPDPEGRATKGAKSNPNKRIGSRGQIMDRVGEIATMVLPGTQRLSGARAM